MSEPHSLSTKNRADFLHPWKRLVLFRRRKLWYTDFDFCIGVITDMSRMGFDNQKYLTTQSEQIRKRIAQFGGKLYLEFGGKLFDDYHASRVLPGFLERGEYTPFGGIRQAKS